MKIRGKTGLKAIKHRPKQSGTGEGNEDGADGQKEGKTLAGSN